MRVRPGSMSKTRVRGEAAVALCLYALLGACSGEIGALPERAGTAAGGAVLGGFGGAGPAGTGASPGPGSGGAAGGPSAEGPCLPALPARLSLLGDSST